MKNAAGAPASAAAARRRSPRAVRRLAAALCLAACGGFVFGIVRGRLEGEAADPVPPSADLSGAATGHNAFTAPDARAMQAGDYDRALDLLHAELAAERSPARRRELADRAQEIGLSAHMRDRGEGRVALLAFEDALAVYREERDGPATARALANLADALTIKGERPRAAAAWAEALEIAAREKDAPLEAMLLQRAGDFSCAVGDYDAARKRLSRALAMHQAQGDAAGIAHDLRYLGLAAADTGDYPAAFRHLSESARLLHTLGDKETRAAVFGIWGDARLRSGDVRGAIPLYDEGLAVWRSRGQAYWTAVFLARRADASARLGRHAEAKAMARESLRLLETSNGPVARALPLHVLGDVARAEGDRPLARRYHAEALALRRRLGNPRFIAEAEKALRLDGES